MRTKTTLALLCAAAAVTVAGCGTSDDGDESAAPGSPVSSIVPMPPTTFVPVPAGSEAFGRWWNQWSTDPCSVLGTEDLIAAGIAGTQGISYPTQAQERQCMWRSADRGVSVRIVRDVKAAGGQPVTIAGRAALAASHPDDPQKSWTIVVPVDAGQAGAAVSVIDFGAGDGRALVQELAGRLVLDGRIPA